MTYPGAWAKIERVDNGWIVRGPGEPLEDETVPEVIEVYQDPEAGEELSSLQDALWAVVEFLSAGGSKHDPERIFITTRTGLDTPKKEDIP